MPTSRITPAVAKQLKAAIDASIDPHATQIQVVPDEGQTSTDSDGALPHDAAHQHDGCTALAKGTSAYSRDQKLLLRWVGGVIAFGVLSWSTWITTEVYALKTSGAVARAQSDAIQAQLGRIESQIAEMRRDLRGRP